MQSLDSSCQEADFIINDTLKKLKGSSNSTNSLTGSTGSTLASNNSTTGAILRQQQQQLPFQLLPSSSSAQHQHKFQPYQQIPSTASTVNVDCSNSNLTTSPQQNVSQQQLCSSSPTSPPSLVSSSSFSVTFPPKSSLIDNSLLHCNISHIPSQPPLCIFEDDEEPSNPTEQPPAELLAPSNSISRSLSNIPGQNQNLNSSICLDNIVILAPALSTPASIQQNIPLPQPSPHVVQSSSFSNFNSITSPSPVVPDLLLSTPPGVHNSISHSNNSNHNNIKKADKRCSSSSVSVNQQYQQNQISHNSHILPSPGSVGSPTSSPSKRQRTKDSIISKSTCSGFSSGQITTQNTFLTSSTGSKATKQDNTSQKFFNIHERIKDHYLQLLANDLNLFTEVGLKLRTRSFVLERVVECERLNTIVINLYPGNKGYALALYYDDRQVLSDTESELSSPLPTVSSSFSSTTSISSKNTSSRGLNTMINNSVSNSNRLYPSSIPPDFKHKTSYDNLSTACDGSSTDLTPLANEFSLVEVLRWPYENDQLLQCIDREVIPDFLMDMLSATTITLQAPHDDSTGTPRVYYKPNVFYAGCVVAQIRDFRQTFATSTNICDMKHVLLRPTNSILFANIQHVATTLNQSMSACAPDDKIALESQMVLAAAEPLCLDPDPNIGRHAINSQHERQLYNTYELRRQMKKYTQISINRKRKLDQFTHHYGLELCDYLTRLRTRPRSGITSNVANVAANVSTNGGVSPLVSATMLTSFASKVPKRPKDVIRPIRPPKLEYPVNLKVPEHLINVEKYAKTNERPRETTDCQPQLIEEYILETERDDNEGRRVVYHIKLSIFQRPSNSEYLGELYVDRDYREGIRNGESCRFPLGTRVHANRYIQQFTEIFTEEGRKAVKITHIVPGHLPKITHTGITPEQRQALILQQQQLQLQQQRQFVTQQQQHQAIQQTITQHHTEQQQHQHLVVVGPNGQQQHLLPTAVQHLNTNSMQTQPQTLPPQQHQQHVAKNINIVNVTGNNVAAVQHVLRQQQMQQQHQVATTQFVDANGATVQLQHATLTTTTSNNSSSNPVNDASSVSSAPHHIQLQQISSGATATAVGVNNSGSSTTTHQLSLSNGSLVLVQQHSNANSQALHQQQSTQALQNAGITIQPASSHQQQKAQIVTTSQMNTVQSTQNSALRTQLSSNVPILQAHLKSAPIVTNTTQQQQQQLIHKQTTANTSTNPTNVVTGNSGVSNSTTNSLQGNPAISAIVTSIMNSANQWQQQQNSSISNSSAATALKNSSNASILSLLNSAPAAMTSTPVASGTFTTSTGQTVQQQQQQNQTTSNQQNVTLVQHSSHSQHQQQQPLTTTVVASDSFVQASQSHAVPNQSQRKTNEVLQNLLNPGRKINIVSSNAGGSGGTTATFRTNSAGNLIALNLNQSSNHSAQSQQSQHHQQQIHSHQQQLQQDQQPQTTVRVSMSALASQLASPPAIMTNSTNFGGYTLSTVGGTGSSGSIKILNSGIQQQRVLANALRRDSLSSTPQGPPNAIVVGVAAPSPGSDSNASNASGFAVPQATSSSSVNSNNSTALSSLLTNTTTPSPSGSEHSQSSQNQSQNLLERLNSSAVTAGTALPNMSPQQHHSATSQQQYITKSLVQSPATSSIHSPMSSPHPQPSPSPHLPPPPSQQQQQPQQQQQQQNQTQTQTATLNLQGINFSTLQGAMANFPGLQNVQVQIPGFNQPISLQLSGGSLHAVQQSQQSGNTTVSVVAAGASANSNNSASAVVAGQNTNSGQQSHQQQRSLLVSVPVSSASQQQGQTQHTITLQPQHLQQHHNASASSTLVNLPTNAIASGSTQTVVLTNNSVVSNTSGTNNTATNASNSGATMLTLPIAHLVGSGVQKLNSGSLRTTGTGPSSTVVTTTNSNTAGGGSIIVQQNNNAQQQQKTSHQPQQATITVSSAGTGNQTNPSIQLVGTIQQGGRNIQVVGAKQLSGSRQLIAQRQIGSSTLKIAAAPPINANSNVNLTSSGNLTATPIVMSTQKLQLKSIKSHHQSPQQQHQRILNQITAQTSPTGPQPQTVILSQQQTTIASAQQQSATSHAQQQQHIQIQARPSSNLTQRTISAIAIAKHQQQHQQQQAAAAGVAAASRRRPATDVSK